MAKLRRTRQQLEKILLDNMRAILGSGVTSQALRRPSVMTIDDIVLDLHLCERLCNAFGALRAMKKYRRPDHEFVMVSN